MGDRPLSFIAWKCTSCFLAERPVIEAPREPGCPQVQAPSSEHACLLPSQLAGLAAGRRERSRVRGHKQGEGCQARAEGGVSTSPGTRAGVTPASSEQHKTYKHQVAEGRLLRKRPEHVLMAGGPRSHVGREGVLPLGLARELVPDTACVEGTHAVERKEPAWEPGLPAPRGPRGLAVGMVPRESRNKGRLGREGTMPAGAGGAETGPEVQPAGVGRAAHAGAGVPGHRATPSREHQRSHWEGRGLGGVGRTQDPGSLALGAEAGKGCRVGRRGPGRRGLSTPSSSAPPGELLLRLARGGSVFQNRPADARRLSPSQFDLLEMDRLERPLVNLPLLLDPSSYVPDTVDLTDDAPARKYWLTCFEEALDGVRARGGPAAPGTRDGRLWKPWGFRGASDSCGGVGGWPWSESDFEG